MGRTNDAYASRALQANLAAVAEKPGEPARIVTYDTVGVARTTATQLRSGRKFTNRPAGEWEFFTGETEDGRFGVWARFTPPEQ
jgi:hypothetical protein